MAPSSRLLKSLSRVTLAPAALIAYLAGCAGDNVPAGRILVKNDSQDREYNVITVSGGGSFASLKPGERFLLPQGIRSFSVQRRYRDYTRAYSVNCPPLGDRGISMRLIDIHVNRMPGGCKTVEASKG